MRRLRQGFQPWVSLIGLAILTTTAALIGLAGAPGRTQDGNTKSASGTGGTHPASCRFGPTPGFLEGTVRYKSATELGVSAGSKCIDMFPVSSKTVVCWSTCPGSWALAWRHLGPKDTIDIETAMSGNSLRPQWIDVDSTAENGVITSIAAGSFEVQLTRQPYGSDRVIITPTTIITSNGASTSAASLHVGQGIYVTGSAAGPGPDTRKIYAVRVILDL